MIKSKKFKKMTTVFLVCAAIATSTLGITASAMKLSFYFNLSDKGGSSWSSGNEKDDNEQTAHIHTTSGTASSSAYIYFQLYKNTDATSANTLSNAVKITSNSGEYLIPYTVYRGAGSISYIHANAGYYGASSSGYWYA